MFCKYKETTPPEQKPARDTLYRVVDHGDGMLGYGLSRYKIVRDELVWKTVEHSSSNDKDAAEKIAALLNGAQ